MMSQLEIRTRHQPDKMQLYHKPHWPDHLHSFKTLPSPYFGTSWPVQQLLVLWCQEKWSDLAHSYMDKNIQKAFINGIPKCFEHQGKLAIRFKRNTGLSVCWLDLAIAYGIVHHQLIHFTPSASWFTLWSTSTLTSMWLSQHRQHRNSTTIGVFQGNPLCRHIQQCDVHPDRGPPPPPTFFRANTQYTIFRWHLFDAKTQQWQKISERGY